MSLWTLIILVVVQNSFGEVKYIEGFSKENCEEAAQAVRKMRAASFTTVSAICVRKYP